MEKTPKKENLKKEIASSFVLDLATSRILGNIFQYYNLEDIFPNEDIKIDILSELQSSSLKIGKLEKYISNSSIKETIESLNDEEIVYIKNKLSIEILKYLEGGYKLEEKHILEELENNLLYKKEKEEILIKIKNFVKYFKNDANDTLKVRKLLSESLGNKIEHVDSYDLPDNVSEAYDKLNHEIMKFALSCSDICYNDIAPSLLDDKKFLVAAKPLSSRAFLGQIKDCYDFLLKIIEDFDNKE